MPINSTGKKYDCMYCLGDGKKIAPFGFIICSSCGGKGKVTGKQLKRQIINQVPNNLNAIEMIEIYELNG